MKKRVIFFFLFICLVSKLLADEHAVGPRMIFEENKNQWPTQVLFEADFAGGKLFLEKNKFTYLLIEKTDLHEFHHHYDENSRIKYHAFNVNFQESNPLVRLNGSKAYSFHRNYYLGNDSSKWASNVKLYENIYYTSLYHSIDMSIYNEGENLKYDLIVHPGGNPNDIHFNYDGVDAVSLKDGNLYLKTSLGDVIEQKPFSYQIINGVKKEVACSYKLNKNILSFSIDTEYDKILPLIIDPVLVASTYTGSFADNWGYTATYDNAGNIYTAGIAATAGYPTTLGAFDNTFNGGMPWGGGSYPFDISITKYNANGTAILFSTYYGGSLNEQPHSLFVNSANELYVTGRANSVNFPTTSGVYDATHNGGYDIIVGKFNTSGALLASTFVGGTGDDGVNISSSFGGYNTLKFSYADDGRGEIILDGSSNVYVVGSTRSSDFPTSAGAYDASLGGSQDGCVLKMNSNLTSLVFSTYLGGSANDAAYGIKLSGSNVYVTGGTASNDFPTTSGVINTSYKGGTVDGYISAFNSTATSLLYSTFMGTAAYDQSYMIETDATGDIYVFGQTMGAYPVSSGVYSNANSKQFIHKLNSQLNATVFSTVIGNGSANPNISPTAFLVDSCQSIYLSGWGRCSSIGNPSPANVIGMPITSNAFQSTTDGCDFYFMVLRPNAQSLLYATYFGENSPTPDHVDGGTSRFDKRGFIYQSVCASCGGKDNFPTTSTAWSKTNNSTNCNNAVVKMDLQVAPLAVASIGNLPNGCAPYTVSFNAAGSGGTGFLWNFGDGSPTTNSLTVSHTYTNPGTYKALLIVSDSTGTCGQKDTAEVVINVGIPPTLVTSHTPVICNGQTNGTATVVASGGLTPYTYLWSNGQTGATASGLGASTYSVTVTNVYGCAATATATVTQPAVLSSNTTFTNVGCNGGANGTATASVVGGTGPYSYVWLPGAYSTSSITGLSIGSYSLAITDAKGCTTQSSANITQPPPLSISSTIVNATCGQPNGSASVAGTGGFAPYTWTWSGGQSGATVNSLAAGTYTVTIQDLNLCTYSAPISITNTSGPVASITSNNVTCNGVNNGSATITTTGGALPFTYLWSNGQTTPTATNLGAGIYSVVATDANNCSATASTTISQPPLLIANAVGVAPSCNGFTDGSVQVGALGGTPPYSYFWAISGTPTTAAVQGLGSGVYNVTVVDANACLKLASVTLNNPSILSVSISSTAISCNGACDGTATATVSNGTPPYFYSWSDNLNQATPTVNGLCAGTYSVAVTDAGGCPANAVAFINTPQPLTASVFSKGNVTCYGTCNGFAQLSVNGGTPPYTYNWSSGSTTNATNTGLCAGAFTCTITDANACSFVVSDSITQPEPLLGAVNVVKVPCNGQCTGEMIATYSGGTPPYNYLWLPGLQTTNNPKTLCAGTQTITVTDSLGCIASGQVELTEPTAISATISTTTASCNQSNGGACVVVSGGTPTYRYQWSSGVFDTLSCISSVVANTYNLTITDGMGCVLQTNANINNVAGPVVIITNFTHPTCYDSLNGTATISISSGVAPYTYLWSPGGQTVQNPTDLGSGINTVTVTDVASCVGSESVLIITPPELVSAITDKKNVSCFAACDGEATVLYGGGTAPVSIVWSVPGSPSTPTVSGLCAGNYGITVSDGNGCMRIDSFAVITEPNELVMQSLTSKDISCSGFNDGFISTLVSGGNPLYTFNWSPNVSSDATATNLTAGSYTLTVVDTSGCSVSQTWLLDEPQPLTLNLTTVPSACNFTNGQALATVAGGVFPYVYQWNDIGLQATAQATNLAAGNYICTVRDSNNCAVTDNVTIASLPGPTIDSIVSTDVLCNGGISGTATVYTNPNNGTQPFTYLWSPSSQTTATATTLEHGAYNVIITDVGGCSTNGSVIVNEPPPLTLVVSPIDTVCYRDTAQIYAQAVGGTPGYIYSWTGGGVSLSGSGPHLYFPDSATVFTIIVSDINGCSVGPVMLQLSTPPPLVVTASADVAICDGDSTLINVTASGGSGNVYTYLWSNGNTSQSQFVLPTQIVSPVTYVATVDDGCSQPATDSVMVSVYAGATGSFTQSSISGCEPLTVNFDAVGDSTALFFLWNYGDFISGNGASTVHTFLNDSLYNVILTIVNVQGCSTQVATSNAITVFPKPDADFTTNPSPASSLYPLVDYTDISTTTIVSWFWNFEYPNSLSDTSSLQNPSHTYDGVGTYITQLMVENNFGCRDTVDKQIDVIDEFVFYAPNTFTPNEDDVNEIFLPVGVGWDISTYELYIFDRWGELIHYTPDYKEGWNGKVKGGKELVQNEVYVWKVNLKDTRGNKHRYIGHVTMLK
jgi:gliding motility-associated-like protein